MLIVSLLTFHSLLHISAALPLNLYFIYAASQYLCPSFSTPLLLQKSKIVYLYPYLPSSGLETPQNSLAYFLIPFSFLLSCFSTFSHASYSSLYAPLPITHSPSHHFTPPEPLPPTLLYSSLHALVVTKK